MPTPVVRDELVRRRPAEHLVAHGRQLAPRFRDRVDSERPRQFGEGVDVQEPRLVRGRLHGSIDLGVGRHHAGTDPQALMLADLEDRVGNAVYERNLLGGSFEGERSEKVWFNVLRERFEDGGVIHKVDVAHSDTVVDHHRIFGLEGLGDGAQLLDEPRTRLICLRAQRDEVAGQVDPPAPVDRLETPGSGLGLVSREALCPGLDVELMLRLRTHDRELVLQPVVDAMGDLFRLESRGLRIPDLAECEDEGRPGKWDLVIGLVQ